jgi:hypothetical protein
MGRAYRTNGEKKNTYMLLVEKPERRRPIGRLRRMWVDNIKIDLGEVECSGMDWIDLDQNGEEWEALLNAVMNLRVL